MIKNCLNVFKYSEFKSFANRKNDFNINTIKPFSDEVVTKIKDKFPFCKDFDLFNELTRLRELAAAVKFKDASTPRQSEKNHSLKNLSASIKNLMENIENLDENTHHDLSILVEKEIPGADVYINNELLSNLQKILNVIEKSNPPKDVGGRKKQNLKFFIVYQLLSIYRRGINKKIVINYDADKESYYGDTFDFLSICNECLKLDLGSSHAIVKIAKSVKTYNKT